MSKIQELAFTLNLSAGIPGMNIQSKTADKFDEYAKDLYDYTLNNLEDFLSISDNDGYHVGMAFSHILERTPYIETENDFTDEASVADLHYMKDVKHTYHDCSIYGDKGYIGADVQLDLFETAHIRLECPYRLNQKDWKPTFIPFAKARKRIETIFSQLTDQFLVIRNYAKITNGLFARIIGKISALTILQYVNFINDKPIGRIKYALN